MKWWFSHKIFEKGFDLKDKVLSSQAWVGFITFEEKDIDGAKKEFKQVLQLDKEGRFEPEAQEYLQLIP